MKINRGDVDLESRSIERFVIESINETPIDDRRIKSDTVINEFNSKSIWYHTDDFCQIELQPDENLEALRNECAEITKRSAGKANADLPAKIRTADRGIRVADLISLFEKHNYRTNREVYSGSISHPRIAPDALAFTKGTITFYCRFEQGMVKNIFTDVNRPPDPKIEYKKILEIVGQEWNLILVDWQKLVAVELDNEMQLDNYLAAKYRVR